MKLSSAKTSKRRKFATLCSPKVKMKTRRKESRIAGNISGRVIYLSTPYHPVISLAASSKRGFTCRKKEDGQKHWNRKIDTEEYPKCPLEIKEQLSPITLSAKQFHTIRVQACRVG